MSVEGAGGEPPGPDQQMSEEELRARIAEELKKVEVRDVLLQNVVTLINVGGQRLGIGDAADARDLDQARLAIESVRAQMPLIEEREPGELAPLRDALAQLQMIYAREVGAAEAPASPGSEPSDRSPVQPPEPPAAPDQKPSRGRQSGGGGIWTPPGSQT